MYTIFLKQDVQIQCNTGTYNQTFFPSAIRLWNTLPVDICQLRYLLTVSRPISTVSIMHVIWAPDYTSCFYHLHCTVFVRSYCSLFAAQLSQYTSAYSLVVWYIARNRVGTRHCYRKMKMIDEDHEDEQQNNFSRLMNILWRSVNKYFCR